ncbi:MAG TPA: hypothetical protein VMU77_08065, partial [Acidimicrobiales bacterium]|nr:hypothetical protein [Acidimicrobiales bacterium]
MSIRHPEVASGWCAPCARYSHIGRRGFLAILAAGVAATIAELASSDPSRGETGLVGVNKSSISEKRISKTSGAHDQQFESPAEGIVESRPSLTTQGTVEMEQAAFAFAETEASRRVTLGAIPPPNPGPVNVVWNGSSAS